MRTIKLQSPLESAILGLLSHQEMSGYDLRKVFSRTPFDRFSDSPGAIYPALRRLERAGWLAGSAPAGGRRRTTFRLTAAGRRGFNAWLAREPTRDEVVGGMDGLMVRFAFAGGVLPRRSVLQFLEAFVREVRGHLADLERYRQEQGTGPSLTGRLAFEAGVASYEAYAAWARRAQAALLKEGRTS